MPFLWDNPSTYHTVSNGGLTVTCNTGGIWTLSESLLSAKSSGKWYIEVRINNVPSGGGIMVGFSNADTSVDNGLACLVGSPWGVVGASWQDSGSLGYCKSPWVQGYTINPFFTSGDVLGFALDMDNEKIWFYKNGTLIQSGDPTAGTGACITNTSGDVHLIVNIYGLNGSVTVRFLDAEQSYSAPAGFSPLEIFIPLVQFGTFLDQPYTILQGDQLAAMLEQLYGVTFERGTSLEQLYSIVSEIWLTQHYGDVPIIGTSLEQPYSWASVIHKSLLQRWGDALYLETSLEQPWTMPDMLQAVSEQSYGITTAILQATCEQLYHINANSSLFANLIQPYALAGEAARLYQFDTRLYVNGERIRYHSLEWQATESEYAISCDFSVKLQADAMKCVDGAEIRITSAGDIYLLKCYGGWFLDKRHGSEVYRVSGYSRTRDLDLAMPLLGDLPAGMASQLVADLAAPSGITVDWQMADGYIEAGKITANDETPLTVIKNIVHDARGIVLSTPAGNLLIVAEEEVPIPDWATVTPADTIIARLERISTSEQRDEQRGYNFFKVSDQLASGDGYRFEEVSIDAHTKEIRLFVTPMNADRKFALGHSGGADVSIEPFGIQPLVIVNELVEFIAGSGQTSMPIYNITGSTWQETDLGSFTHTETGLLTADIPEYSLLLVSYQTRYFRWIGRDRNIKHVQFIYYEVTA